MTFFFAYVKIDSVFLSRFSLLNQVQVFSCAISSISHLKHLYSSPYFCFLGFVILMFVLGLRLQLLVTATSHIFLVYSSSCHIYVLK